MRRDGRKTILRYASCLLLFVLLLQTAVRAQASADRAEQYEEGICSFLCSSAHKNSVQEWLDGDAESIFSRPAEWYYMAFVQSGEAYDFRAFGTKYAAYIEGKSASGATWLNRRMICWSMGIPLPSDEEIRSRVQGDIMSLVYGLHLSNNTKTAYVTPQALLERQCEDGGFSLRGDIGDPDVTAMTLEALAPYYGTETNVTAAVDRALAFLSGIQLENGGFQSFGSDNCESVCQVIIALSSLGIDCRTDERFRKNGETLFTTLERFRCADGSFRHREDGEASEIATAEALCAMVSYRRLREGKPGLYHLTRKDLGIELPKEPTETVTVPPTPSQAKETEASPKETQAKKAGYLPFVIAGIWILAGAVLLLLTGRKRLSGRNVLFTLGIAATLTALVLLTDFETVKEHYDGYDVENPVGTVTLTIRCDTVAGENGLPADGVILAPRTCPVADGDTAFAVLERVTKKERIAMDFTGGGTSVYVKGIADLYEFDYGDMSGWIYRVNGVTMPVGCGAATVAPGDEIEFLYTKLLGEDLE
ncbi:MAG: DUF4430 domain-containing protein [Lachnospiraceae bacterium]|nr:DUF4430 domain-containing protein [Lachnospiraceae bacterium]